MFCSMLSVLWAVHVCVCVCVCEREKERAILHIYALYITLMFHKSLEQ